MGGLQEAIQRRVLVLDGAMGTSLQSLDLDVDTDYLGRENCVDMLVRSRPDLVRSIHESFLAVGADAVETDTFGANRVTLGEFDEEAATWARDLNRDAASIAREACDGFSTADKPRFVLGSMGPGTKLPTLGQVTWSVLLESYAEQAAGLLDGGVDGFLIETCQDLLQIRCAINACLAVLQDAGRSPEDVPILVNVTIETTGTMLMGSQITAALHALHPFPIASLGLNCATGPNEMTDHVAALARSWDRCIAVVPNAGLPVMVEGRSSFPLAPAPLAAALLSFVEHHGVGIVGGCCGTTPAHIEAVVAAVGDRAPATRDPQRVPSLTSLYGHVALRQESSFLNVGERCNASGSRRFKRLLESGSWDEMISLAREQVREGCNVLDLNVDLVGRDNAADMAELVGRIARQVDAPLMLDSTQESTLEAGLQHVPGKCVINSTNFEDGDGKFDAICRLARIHGAGLVIGTIDEDEVSAMARTADRKVAIAQRAIRRATEVHGIALSDLLIDPLVLPISTGMDDDRRSALELIEGTRRIREAFPDCQVIGGLSNCSFGLKPVARVVLNSVLLHELIEAGLTGAIVHAARIRPLHRIEDAQRRAALNLIHDRRDTARGGTGLPRGVTDPSHDPLRAFIDLFPDEGVVEDAVTTVDRTLEEWLQAHIVDGELEHLIEHLDEALRKYRPLEIVNDHLLAGMKVVGELFASGQMQLPFVLQSAEVMKKAVDYLEPHMDKVGGRKRGAIVLATVRGDVHDIGKNLVDIILTNNGYSVHNLGIKQPLSSIVDAWRETGADAIGMSGLLVKSVMVMEENLRELNALEDRPPVLLGGAALSRHYCESRLRSLYDGPCYYGRDAFEGLRICEHLAEENLGELDDEIEARLAKRAAVEQRVAAAAPAPTTAPTALAERSDVARGVDVPAPPFLGSRVVAEIPLDEIYPFVNRAALYRGQWGFKKGRRGDASYAAFLEDEADPVFDELAARCREEAILQPKVAYGWWRCRSEGDDLLVLDPADPDRVLERFSFPRQETRRRLCISDFFHGADEGDADVVGFHCVTMGLRVSEQARVLFEDDRYTQYLYLHGMGVECAEALAELWHKRMRAELGIGNEDSPRIRELFTQHYRGSRYSFGYPACPEMADQGLLFRLLEPQRIGCTLTENWQIVPEQSTSAIIVHHPEAKYFNV